MKSMKVLVLVFVCLVAYVVDARVCPVCPGSNILGLGLYPKGSGVFTAVINSPRDGGRFMEGEGIHFEGVSDESISTGEWWTYSYSWVSSRDGVLSNTRFFASNSLSHGRHRIAFSVTKVDYEGTTSYTSVDNISLIVEPHPLRVRIKSPPPEETYLNSNVTFQALVTGGIGPYSCGWVSSMDGFIGGGMNFSTKLSVGTHEITFTAVDRMGRTARDETFIAVARSAEIPLRISIVSPGGDETYREGDSVNLITSMSGVKNLTSMYGD
ncbi:MAG: hypothetical protein U9Q22_00040 [Candidatus Altiarchaeota archaeon]|nr:hypothetical protein [Candidatus Altiarchaeota archaeon]